MSGSSSHFYQHAKIGAWGSDTPRRRIEHTRVGVILHACITRSGALDSGIEGIGTEVVIDEISLTNPFDIWAFLKSVPWGLAKEVGDRTIFYREERRRRQAEAGRVQQAEISDKLDNLRKAAAIREELLSAGGDPEQVTELLGKILYDQDATLTVSDGRNRRRTPPRPPF